MNVTVNRKPLCMEVDTGAAVSLISAEDKATFFPPCSLSPTTLTLSTYTGEAMPVLGQMVVEVSYNQFRGHLHLYVVGGKGPPLMGRDWLRQIRLDWVAGHSQSNSLYCNHKKRAGTAG